MWFVAIMLCSSIEINHKLKTLQNLITLLLHHYDQQRGIDVTFHRPKIICYQFLFFTHVYLQLGVAYLVKNDQFLTKRQKYILLAKIVTNYTTFILISGAIGLKTGQCRHKELWAL